MLNVSCEKSFVDKKPVSGDFMKILMRKKGFVFPVTYQKNEVGRHQPFYFKVFLPDKQKTRRMMKILTLGHFFPKISATVYSFLFLFSSNLKKDRGRNFFQVGWVTGNINLFFFRPYPTFTGSCSESFFSTYLTFSGCT